MPADWITVTCNCKDLHNTGSRISFPLQLYFWSFSNTATVFLVRPTVRNLGSTLEPGGPPGPSWGNGAHAASNVPNDGAGYHLSKVYCILFWEWGRQSKVSQIQCGVITNTAARGNTNRTGVGNTNTIGRCNTNTIGRSQRETRRCPFCQLNCILCPTLAAVCSTFNKLCKSEALVFWERSCMRFEVYAVTVGPKRQDG